MSSHAWTKSNTEGNHAPRLRHRLPGRPTGVPASTSPSRRGARDPAANRDMPCRLPRQPSADPAASCGMPAGLFSARPAPARRITRAVNSLFLSPPRPLCVLRVLCGFILRLPTPSSAVHWFMIPLAAGAHGCYTWKLAAAFCRGARLPHRASLADRSHADLSPRSGWRKRPSSRDCLPPTAPRSHSDRALVEG